MAFASSSRPLLPSLPLSLPARRTVIHHARPPRIPVLSSPHNPKVPLPTSGTSHPNPASSSLPPASTKLEGTYLTLHHSPPPTAPSYTTGRKPDLLRWIDGESVRLTGEEQAPRRRDRRERAGSVTWGEEMVRRMRQLRESGLSRTQIAQELSIPSSQTHLIAGAAPLTPAQRTEVTAALEAEKQTWGYRKRLARESRQRRRAFCSIREINRINERELQLGIKGSWHDEYKDSAYVFVGRLPFELTEGDVITVFSQWGEIVDINLPRDKETGKTRGFGFVMYEDQRSTVLAVDNMNGASILGRTIREVQSTWTKNAEGEHVAPEEPSYNAMPPILSGSEESESSASEAGDDLDEEDPMAAFLRAEKKKEKKSTKRIEGGSGKRKHEGESKEERRMRREAKRARKAEKERKRSGRGEGRGMRDKERRGRGR
ncbi:hypothetical protein EHS25_009091 [Saitozyma podzolica]|uniref:RRM domain-containing protein n=1 Tax=Saitozyma podzolica TaxID=1890683 RepID=A0A427YKT7_9TREE|nr:hypothetical protein EHS25_009091 [Saitozyma podzolica]